jgi:hypothetical protein
MVGNFVTIVGEFKTSTQPLSHVIAGEFDELFLRDLLPTRPVASRPRWKPTEWCWRPARRLRPSWGSTRWGGLTFLAIMTIAPGLSTTLTPTDGIWVAYPGGVAHILRWWPMDRGSFSSIPNRRGAASGLIDVYSERAECHDSSTAGEFGQADFRQADRCATIAAANFAFFALPSAAMEQGSRVAGARKAVAEQPGFHAAWSMFNAVGSRRHRACAWHIDLP